MWKESEKVRLERYQEILGKNVNMFMPVKEKANADRKGSFFVSGQRQTFLSVCDYVLAPVLDAYVLWVLKEALDTGKKRLYFLARDGYLMYRTAQIYCSKFSLPIECRYLCCSRYSIRIPMFHLDMSEAMDYICRGGIDVTLGKILKRAALTGQEQKEVLEQIGMEQQQDEHIPYAEIPQIREKLENCHCFGQFVIRHSKEALPNLTGYLRQEGLLDNISYGLVDSGWVGSMQKMLGRAVAYMTENEFPSARMEGYYWGLYELPEGVFAGDYHCFYFTPGNNLREKVYFNNCLFEGVFSAPHGMTMGYRKEKGYYHPVYANCSPGRQWFMEEMEAQILRCIRGKAEAILEAGRIAWPEVKEFDILKHYLARMDTENNHQTIYRLLKTFMGKPTREEAEFFGTLQFSDDVLDESRQQIAAPLSQQELTDNHVGNKVLTMLGIKKGYVKESAWYEGSVVRGGQDVSKHLRLYAAYKYLLYLRKKCVWSKRKDG